MRWGPLVIGTEHGLLPHGDGSERTTVSVGSAGCGREALVGLDRAWPWPWPAAGSSSAATEQRQNSTGGSSSFGDACTHARLQLPARSANGDERRGQLQQHRGATRSAGGCVGVGRSDTGSFAWPTMATASARREAAGTKRETEEEGARENERARRKQVSGSASPNDEPRARWHACEHERKPCGVGHRSVVGHEHQLVSTLKTIQLKQSPPVRASSTSINLQPSPN
jgi:hypothetical protein